MEVLNGVPNLYSLKNSDGLSYIVFKKKLKPCFHMVWKDMFLCVIMMFLPAVFFKMIASNSLIEFFAIPFCALWSAFWIHAYCCFFHEAAHFNIHPNKKINDRISNFLLSPFLGMMVKHYRVTHWEHHKHLGSNKDTEISYKSALSLSGILQIIFGVHHVKVILRYISNFKSVDSKQQKKSSSINFLIFLFFAAVFQIAISFIMLAYISIAASLTWLVSYFIFYPMFAKVRQTLEHRSINFNKTSGLTAHEAVNRIFGNDFFSKYFGAAGFNKHLIHHYDPTVSYTNFHKLEEFLNDTPVAKEIDNQRSTYPEIFLKLLER